MALPNFAINPYVQPYVGGVQKETGELISQRVQDYDIAAEAYDVLGYQTDTLLNNVAPFEADRLYGQELMGKYRNVVNEAAERGDYEFMVRDVKRAARQFGAETNPLLARRKAFDNYKSTVQEQYQKGDIDLEMYNAALNRTIRDNSNVDKQTVMSGAFSGFVPSKRMDMTKYLDDFIKGMEAQGRIGKIVNNPDGTYTIESKEFRTMADIKAAAMRALSGSSEYSNYATTLLNLGLADKLAREENGALDAVQLKYRFLKDKSQQGFTPDGWYDRFGPTDPLISSGDTPSNVKVTNKYDGMQIVNGRVLVDDDYNIVQNGKVYRYVNQEGKVLSKTDKLFAGIGISPTSLMNPAVGKNLADLGIKVQEVPQEELEKATSKLTEQLKDDAKMMFLFNKEKEGKVPQEWLANPEQYKDEIDAYTNATKGIWGSNEYLQQTKDAYTKAAKKAGVTLGNRLWESSKVLSGVQQMEKPANLAEAINILGAGRKVSILSTNKDDRGDIEDTNAALNRVTEEGKYQIEGITRVGVSQWNTNMEMPGIRYNILLTDPSKKEPPKTVSLVVGQEDGMLQPLQDVMTMAGTGRRGEREIAYNTPEGSVKGKFVVTMVPNQKESEEAFIGNIQVYDRDNKLVKVLTPQEFADYYKNQILPPNYIENTYFQRK